MEMQVCGAVAVSGVKIKQASLIRLQNKEVVGLIFISPLVYD